MIRLTFEKCSESKYRTLLYGTLYICIGVLPSSRKLFVYLQDLVFGEHSQQINLRFNIDSYQDAKTFCENYVNGLLNWLKYLEEK